MENNLFLAWVLPVVGIALQIIVGIILAVLGFFLKRYFREIDKKNADQDRKIEDLRTDLQKLALSLPAEQDLKIGKVNEALHNLAASLPHAYVLREDWIRNMTSFDFKLEKVRKGVDELRHDSLDSIENLRKYFIAAIDGLRKDFTGKGVAQ